jgi:hypothetical protein
VPLLIPPAQSNPAPPLFGVASAWAYPMGNGNPAKFYSSVLTSPFSFLGGIINTLTEGGYGITRVQMPEPPSESSALLPNCINPNGYFALGYSAGFMSSDE